MKYVFVNDTVSFTNESSNTYFVTNWNWKIDSTSFATTQDSTYTFDTVGTFDIVLEATGDWGTNTVSKTEQIAVLPTVPPPSIVETTMPDMASGVPYEYRLHVTAGTGYGKITWSAMDLPVGIAIDPDTGIVSGTPQLPEGADPVITVTDAVGRTGTTQFHNTYVNGLSIWMDAAEGVTKDANNLVSSWEYKANNNSSQTKIFTQPTSSAQPEWIADSLNGYPAIKFTQGTSLTSIDNPAGTSTPLSLIIIVYKANGPTIQNTIMFGISADSASISIPTGGNRYMTSGVAPGVFCVHNTVLGNHVIFRYSKATNIPWTVSSCSLAGALDDGFMRQNTSVSYSANGVDMSYGGFNAAISAHLAAGEEFEVCEFIAWRYNLPPTSEELDKVIKYLCKKYGISYLG